MEFDCHIGIDYSGAATSKNRSATIQVYQSDAGEEPVIVNSVSSTGSRHRNWNRDEVAQWLLQLSASGKRFVVGMDHGFSFPQSYFQRYGLKTWDAFLNDFVEHWPTHLQGATVEEFRGGSLRTGDSRDLRLSEQWTSSAKSVFRFDVNGSVAKSTHAGLPFLLQLRAAARNRVHFWPFDGWEVPDGKSIIAETYPSLFRNRYPRQGRTGDQQDAYGVSRWLVEMDTMNQLGRFLLPPLDSHQQKQAKLEGWILGVA